LPTPHRQGRIAQHRWSDLFGWAKHLVASECACTLRGKFYGTFENDHAVIVLDSMAESTDYFT
jgi:hypothetical protein